MDPVLQSRLPFAPWADPVTRRLPGTRAAGPDDWVRVDEAHAGQMALRDRLLAERPEDVVAMRPGAGHAAAELLDAALDRLSREPGYAVGPDLVMRPDAVTVPVDRARPMETLLRLVQEDLCILVTDAAGTHRLAAAALCFPASWTLAEKLGRGMGRIHRPVSSYGAVQDRVDRMLSHLKPGQPVWRANAHLYAEPWLFTPRREADPRPPAGEPGFVRSEFQVLFRLPRSGAVAFSIHSYMVPLGALTEDQQTALAEHPLEASSF